MTAKKKAWMCVWDYINSKEVASKSIPQASDSVMLKYDKLTLWQGDHIMFLNPDTLDHIKTFRVQYLYSWRIELQWLDPQRLLVKAGERVGLYDFGMGSRQPKKITVTCLNPNKKGNKGCIEEILVDPMALFEEYRLKTKIDTEKHSPIACRRFAQSDDKKFYVMFNGTKNRNKAIVKYNSLLSDLVSLSRFSEEHYFYPGQKFTKPEHKLSSWDEPMVSYNVESYGVAWVFAMKRNVNNEWDYTDCSQTEVTTLSKDQKVPEIDPLHCHIFKD